MTGAPAIVVHHGDNREVLKGLADASVDAVVTDPPYGLSAQPDAAALKAILTAWMAGRDAPVKAGGGFMGKAWDAFVPGPPVWRECLRVLKPGGHLVAFFGTRTLGMGELPIRLAGFEIRDLMAWLYGSGFPKSLDVGKAIDKAAGAERKVVGTRLSEGGRSGSTSSVGQSLIDAGQVIDITAPATPEAELWEGWGTALKPALEPIVFARKPLIGTVAETVLKHRTGALNIDACRVEGAPVVTFDRARGDRDRDQYRTGTVANGREIDRGRWPANVVHDGSEAVLAAFPNAPGAQGVVTGREPSSTTRNTFALYNERAQSDPRHDSGSAARFFYSAKAGPDDRLGSDHPTVKPIELMAWLCRLITPPGGVVLDPFAGTGTTGVAARREGFSAILIEQDARHVADIQLRLDHAAGRAGHSSNLKTRNKREKPLGGLFGGSEARTDGEPS